MRKSKMPGYKAVILAGGKGTRLYPVTLEMPKPLLPVGKKPMINYLIDLFYSYGIKEVAILINKDFREDFSWWQKRYYPKPSFKERAKITFFEEKKPLGTFGGLWFLREWIGSSQFFLANADNLTTLNLNKIAALHKTADLIGTVALIKTENPRDYGTVICNSDLVKRFIEKSDKILSKYVNSGWYLLSPKIFDYHSGPDFLMIEKDIFPKLAEEGKLAGFKFQGDWIDCGTWERYKKASENWKRFI